MTPVPNTSAKADISCQADRGYMLSALDDSQGMINNQPPGFIPGSEFDYRWSMPTRDEPTKPRTPPREDDRDRKDDDTPETPPVEAPPVPVKEPPEGPDRRGPFVVG